MNVMTVDDYRATIEYDPELDLFRGEILGLNGGADFYGKNPKELRSEFKRSLQVFLEVCAEKGIEPKRSCTKSSLLQLRQKVKASIPWRRRLCSKALREPETLLLSP
jgi:predicted HicB family RNase H-like nuclease